MAKKEKRKSSEKSDDGTSLILRNKRAFYEYEILERLECGLVLTGSEVKSLRAKNVSFADAYARVQDDRLVLVGLNISEYNMANRQNHEPARTRKLLAHRRQIRKLKAGVAEKGLTLIPLDLHWRRGLAKVEIGLARGKARYDKREAIRKRELDRQQRRIMQDHR